MDYRASIGRFTQEDVYWNTYNMIYGEKSGDNFVPNIASIVQNTNLYNYCGCNPISRFDPYGQSWQDTAYGILTSIDENNFGGFYGWVAKTLTGNSGRVNDSLYDYYTGRVVGDGISALIGAGTTVAGAKTIADSILTGGGISIGSGGTLTAGGITISVVGTAAGTATVSYGVTVVTISSDNFYDNYNKMQEIGMKENRKTRPNRDLKKIKNDAPKWAKEQIPKKGDISADAYTRRILNEKYGEGNWKTGGGSEFSKIKKWAQTHFVW